MVIDGVKYVPADEVGQIRIIVADRGWVFVGRCEDNEDGSVTIRDAKNIRVWGTTSGLGQLIDGPTEKTKSDYYGTVRVTPIVAISANQQGGWNNALTK